MTSPTRSVGRAYVEMHGDYSKLGPEAEKEIQDKLDDAAKKIDFDELGDAAEKGGKKAGERFANGFYRDAQGRLRNAKGRFVKESEHLGEDLLGGLERAVTRGGNRRGGILGVFLNLGQQAFAAFQSGFSTAKDFGKTIGDVFSKVGDVGGEIGSILKIAGLVTLIPIVIQLAGALVQLGAAIFALPAAAGVAITAILPLVIAFQGFGEAVSAGLSGDTEKFNQALKGLAPSARDVVKEFVKLGPQFKSIKQNVQQAFFAPLRGFFTEFGKTLLPLANKGLSLVAGSLGEVGREIGNVFTAGPNLDTFRELFLSTNRIIKDIGPGLGNLAQSFLNLVKPALPFVESLAFSFRQFAFDVNEFTAKIARNGTLTGWLGKAEDALKGIVTVAKEAGEFLLTAFGGEVGDQGRQFIHDLGSEFKRLNEFLKSREGQQELHNLTLVLKAFAAVVIGLLKLYPIFVTGFNGAFDLIKIILRALEALGASFVWLIKTVSEFAVWLGKGIGHAFAVAYRAITDWVTSAGHAIADFFTKDIPRWFGNVVDWFRSLPGRIVDAFSSFRSAGQSFILDTLKAWYDTVFTEIGRIIGIFIALPYLVKTGFQKGIHFLGDLISEAWDYGTNALMQGWDNFVAFLFSIPGLLADAGHAILDFFVNLGQGIYNFLTVTFPQLATDAVRGVGSLLTDLWNSVVVDSYNAVVAGFNRVVDFLGTLPDRVRALGPRLRDAALSLGRKIGEGLQEIGNFASDIGKKITGYIKSGINYVVSRINAGIAEIDAKIPIDLPRLPMLANGAVVDKATLAIVGEAGPEVVVPLSDPRRAQELADKSGLSKILASSKSQPNVQVVVYLDPSGVMIPIARTVVNDSMDEQGQELSYGVRGDS